MARLLSYAFNFCAIVGILFILGAMMDNNDQYHTNHDRCLKQATNGYDIQKCH